MFLGFSALDQNLETPGLPLGLGVQQRLPSQSPPRSHLYCSLRYQMSLGPPLLLM